MIRRAFLIIIVAGSVLLPPLIRAQSIQLAGLNGARFSDADLARGATIVLVWASWSPRSRSIVERTNSIVKRWEGKARVVTVNFQEERPTVEKFLAGKPIEAPVFLDSDGAFSKKYGVATLPALLVFKEGKIEYRGQLPKDADAVIAKFLE